MSLIRTFILEEEGDSSIIETIYLSEKDCENVKKILFLEKVLVVLIVDLIINAKFKLVDNFIRNAVKLALDFYALVYHDLKDSDHVQQ
jgi:hypothetical protein